MLTAQEKRIVVSFAKNNMCVKKVMEELFYNRGTIMYHFGKILRRTGLNPQKFYDLIKLVDMTKAGD